MLHPTEAIKPLARLRPAAHHVSSARTALQTNYVRFHTNVGLNGESGFTDLDNLVYHPIRRLKVAQITAANRVAALRSKARGGRADAAASAGDKNNVVIFS
jgi:hypothetical protein